MDNIHISNFSSYAIESEYIKNYIESNCIENTQDFYVENFPTQYYIKSTLLKHINDFISLLNAVNYLNCFTVPIQLLIYYMR